MQLNGGKLKEVQVSLLLSSRAEMQKVIEKARQATSTPFMNKISATQSSSALSAAVIANQFAKKMPEQLQQLQQQVLPPQPPAISLTNFLTQSMQQQNTLNPSVTQAQQLNLMPAYQTMTPNEMPGLRPTPVTSGFPTIPMGIAPNPAVSAAAYANYYATMLNPTTVMNAYANPLAANFNAKPKDVQRDVSIYSSDPRSRRSNSRERNSYRRHRSRSNERNPSRRSRSNSRERYPDSDKEGKDANSRRRTRFSAAGNKGSDGPNLTALPPSMNNLAVGYGVPPPVASNNVWEHPPPQLFAANEKTPQLSLNVYPSFNKGNSLLPPTRHYQTENKSTAINLSPSSSLGVGTCVKVTNVDSETFYSDLRKFFVGLPIGNNDIKFVNDAKGNRTGVVVVRFLSSDSKKKALTKSLWQLKSTQVMITSISEEDFDSGLANMKSGNRQTSLNNYKNEDRHDSRNDRFRDRSDSRENDYNNRNFNRNDGNRDGNNRNNRFDDRQQNNRDNGGGNFRRGFKNEDQYEKQNEKIKEFKPDENFTVLVIDDIPRTANEPDVFEAFPNIVSITIDRYTAYVKFSSHEAAKVTLENRFIHYIRNKRVFLEAGSDAQFNELARKHGKHENPDAKDAIQNVGDNGSDNSDKNFKNMNDDSNHSNNSNSRDNSRNHDQNSFESRDPRQKTFNNERFGSNGQPEGMKTDCVIMKNMEPNTTIEDVEHFYKDIGIYKMRVHILLDKKGLQFKTICD